MNPKNILYIAAAHAPKLPAIDHLVVDQIPYIEYTSPRPLTHYDLVIVDLTSIGNLQKYIDNIRLHVTDTPIIGVITTAQANMALESIYNQLQGHIEATDLSSAPVLRYVIRHTLQHAKQQEAMRLKLETLERRLDDQKLLRRIDYELGYSLDANRVIHLAIDSALRLTGAEGGSIGWIDESSQQLMILARLGRYTQLTDHIPLAELHHYENVREVLQKSKIIVETEDQYSSILLPLVSRRVTRGIISLDHVPENFYYDQADWEFLQHLVNRTATALEIVSSYERIRFQAQKLDTLNELSVNLARHLERSDVLDAGIASIATLLDVSDVLYLDFQPQTRTLYVEHVYHAPIEHALTIVPVGHVIEMFNYPMLLAMLRFTIFQIRLHDKNANTEDILFIEELGLLTVLLAPIINESGELSGVIAVGESRYDRLFSADEIALVKSFVGSMGISLRKAELFHHVQTLEQTKSEIIHMLSHDMRTPLSRLVLGLTVYERKNAPLTEREQEFVQSVRVTVQEMQNLLEDVLSLEQVESGSTSNWRHFDITEVLERLQRTFSEHAKLRHQTLIAEIPNESITVLGSEIQIQQAFSNYLSNAIKYTPDGGNIVMRAYVKDGFLIFEVEDSGYGIPEEAQAKIFSRFYRAKHPATERIAGTGLGLSLVKTVIERHGGKVWFKSKSGVGSTFSCSIPIKEL
ncbi:MAG: hypothetical protein CUN55_08595 [Phototrophicales bacterium]|nr:MAG: hypothetical protein CUN55_08595 [Phototrophicales bacterium]